MMRFLLSVLFASSAPLAGHAACPQELAVYAAENGDALEFTGNSDAEFNFHQISILLKDGPMLDAYVEANFETSAPEMSIQYNCPDGDLTFDDLKSCTVYRNEVFSVSENGERDELPSAGQPAASAILLPDFEKSLWENAAFEGQGPNAKPAETFKLSGCLE